ncbi:MAG: 2OG-Fe(II) oxygenase [Thioalkalivibrionaceae bacterium]
MNLAAACTGLQLTGFVVLDDWLDAPLCSAARTALHAHQEAGQLLPAGLGRAGARTDSKRRGDVIMWLQPSGDAADAGEHAGAVDASWLISSPPTGDVVWTADDSVPPPRCVDRVLWTRIEALRTALNAELWLGLFDFEAHYAWYPPGARYEPHVDRLRHDDRRMISALIYLNDDWHVARDGGALRLHLTAEQASHARGPDSATARSDRISAAHAIPVTAFDDASVAWVDGGGIDAEGVGDPPDALCLDVAPRAGRLVMFRSDLIRHEVRPALRDRYSIAIWFRRRPINCVV